MRKAHGLFGVRLAAVLALAVSAALFVDYTNPTPTFCGADSGCAAVRGSGYGYLLLGNLPVPVPALGMLCFAGLLGVALVRELRRWVPFIAALGGLTALGLFSLQAFVIKHLCSLCVTVDMLAVCAALAGGLLFFGEPDPSEEEFALRWGAWPALAVLALVAPLAWPALRPAPPVPAGVLKLYQPGKINVVEFADYECPYCRRLHPELKAVIASYPGKVNFTRLNLPLHMHEFAQGAAEAQVCAREQGKGDEMADRLFAAEDLRPEANRALAVTLGLDMAAYDACIKSGKADQIIDAESKILIDSGLQGLPTTFVGSKTIIGVRPEEVFRDAFDRAERGEGSSGIPAPAYWLGVLALAASVCWVGRVRRATL
ncbi:MAG TPA: thioredoxin domain-containing protein [Polyangiaceae bacterium]|nr:thioredoxin domain-containing protein [Polyangiaceae bacterium]